MALARVSFLRGRGRAADGVKAVFERHLKGCSFSKCPHLSSALWAATFHIWSLVEVMAVGLSQKNNGIHTCSYGDI